MSKFKYMQSTRNAEITASPSMALLEGLAPDGGLFIPHTLPEMPFTLEEGLALDELTLTAKVVASYINDLPYESVYEAVKAGYAGKFDSLCLSPVVPLGDAGVLELWHGPTSAFKDMALCVLPRLMAACRDHNEITDELVILTATSGDTGKAALAGFMDAPHTSIVVFYPEQGVSEVQKAQMVTQEGKNVRVCAVRGNFDDAQRGVKAALSEFSIPGKRSSSANSINIGRLAPQSAYYYRAYYELVRKGSITLGEKLDFIVPTGNFGNILSGFMAKRAGLPIGRLVCASNANDVLTEFLSTGVYDTKKRSLIKTASPSMDILVSSNLERLLYFLAQTGTAQGDADEVSRFMRSLAANGRYEVSKSMLERIKAEFDCGSCGDSEAFDTIRRVYGERGYLMDPHTATAYSVYERERAKGALKNPAVILSTASPYKFAPAMLEALHEAPAKDGFDAMEKLSSITKTAIPKNLSSLRDKCALHKDTVDKDGIVAYIKHIV